MSLVLGLLILFATITVFVTVGLSGFHNENSDSVDVFVTARNSQSATTLGLSFLAAGMGAWVLFAPPEVGASIGLLGVLGYAIGSAMPVLVFAWIGPRIRKQVPSGTSINEYATQRFGPVFGTWVLAVSIGYMFFFITAELTSAAGVAQIIAGIPPAVTVLTVAIGTLAYTTIGGLSASLRTDRSQSILIVLLVTIGAIAAFSAQDADVATLADSGLFSVNRVGIEVAVTLILAVTAANLFHQGYWQRVWAAKDTAALTTGSWIGAALTAPVVIVLGFFGIVAASNGVGLDHSPVPFFALTGELGVVMAAVVLVLGIALVTSSVDTLETGFTSLITALGGRSVTLRQARIITVVAVAPALIIALQGFSVLRLFLIADLIAASAVVPLTAGLWPFTTKHGAVWGAIAGLAGAVLVNVPPTGSLTEALHRATFPGAVSTLSPFAGAITASLIVTVAVSAFTNDVDSASTTDADVPRSTEKPAENIAS